MTRGRSNRRSPQPSWRVLRALGLLTLLSSLSRGLHAQSPGDAGAATAAASVARASDAPAPEGRLLSLAAAVRTALERHPSVRVARANEQAAVAQADQALAPLLPSVVATAEYRRATRRGGVVVSNAASQSLAGRDDFQFGVALNQLIYDFEQTHGRLRAARDIARAVGQAVEDQRFDLVLGVKNAYFQARAQLALVGVSRETLANQARHVDQIAGFVDVGTHPPIDLVQARADRESARLDLVNAENAYALAKAELAEAIGMQYAADFEVGDENEPVVPGEDSTSAELFSQALQARPDVRAAVYTVSSREQSLGAARGGYGPSLSGTVALTESGGALDALAFNWSAGASLIWPLFDGGVTRANVAQGQADLAGVQAQLELLRQQVLLALERARLGVQGAKHALGTAAELIALSRERLTLAEGRYETGIGTILELSDAQVALTRALGQRVQAEYNLSIARAQLTRALGR
jgi:outer membrane protein